MASEAICDACGKRAAMVASNHCWHKPRDWYERSDERGIQTACSWQCVKKLDTGEKADSDFTRRRAEVITDAIVHLLFAASGDAALARPDKPPQMGWLPSRQRMIDTVTKALVKETA